MLDAMDVLLFVFAVNSIRDQFGFSAAQAASSALSHLPSRPSAASDSVSSPTASEEREP